MTSDRSLRITLIFFWHGLFFFLVNPFAGLGQEPFCETETDAQFFQHFEQILEDLPAFTKQRFASLIEVPLVFHIEEEGGNPVYSESTLLNKMTLVNTYFAAADVQFTNCAPIIYYLEGQSERINNIINVYLNNGPTGCGSYIGSTVNINVNCNRTFEHILAHELGHALGLPHTHGYTNTGTTTELVDGSNCMTDGDRFCDTPADPNLLGLVNGSCVYTGTGTDANGDAYLPDVTNIMSYTRSTCAYTFSQEQLDKMYMIALARGYECCRIDPPLVSDTTICSGESITLTASTALPAGTIRWYMDSQGGTPVATGATFQTGPLYSSTAYYLEVLDSCISERATLLVTVKPEGGLQLLDAHIFADLDTSAQGSGPYNFTKIGDSAMVFTATGQAIYYTSIHLDTVMLLTDTFNHIADTYLSGIAVLDDNLILATNNFNTGPGLWSLDLPGGAIQLLKSFGANYGYSNYWLTRSGPLVYAQLNNETNSPQGEAELWITDGSVAGTELVKNLAPTQPFVDFSFTPYQDKLIFISSSAAAGEELWISDGTSVNTMLLQDIYPGPTGSRISSITLADGLLYFSADDSLHGQELWVSNGTTNGTNLLVDIQTGMPGSNIYNISALNGSLYFSADDGIHGQEPYKSDGTPEGTEMLADIRADGGSSPGNFIHYAEGIYFTANRSNYDYELFKQDLTTGQISLVKDIHPTGSSSPGNFHVHDGLLFFAANDGQHGNELWQTEGTSISTQMVIDIQEGSGSSSPWQLCSLGDRLLFAANDGSGTEVWTLDVPLLAGCYGDSVVVQTRNTNHSIRWYDSPEGGELLGTGPSIMVYNLMQSVMLYAEIEDQTCTSPRYPVPVTIKANCPCVGPALLTLDQTYTHLDQFTIHALDQLQSTSIFLPGSNMIYKAPTSILFEAGFEVQAGATFQAKLEPCE